MDFLRDSQSKIIYNQYQNMVSNIYYGQVLRTDFLNPYHRDLVLTIIDKERLYYHVYKSYEDCERSLIYFSLDDFDLEDYLKDDVQILYTEDFSSSISHRDVLGALMSLRIERSDIGDILVDDKRIEFVVLKDKANYIRFNLDSIKNDKIRLKEMPGVEMSDFLYRYEDKQDIASSLRLDAILSSMINLSRSKSKNMVEKERVKLNYVHEKDPSKEVSEGDVISIRGYGRFIFGRILGRTKKDKYRFSYRKVL